MAELGQMPGNLNASDPTVKSTAASRESVWLPTFGGPRMVKFLLRPVCRVADLKYLLAKAELDVATGSLVR